MVVYNPRDNIRTRLSATTLQQLLHYNKTTGSLVWRVNRGRTAKAGDEAGTIRNTDGQVVVTVKGRQYLAQRLIWLYVHDQPPKGRLIFLNRDPTDLRWKNIQLEEQYASQTKAAIYQRERRREIARIKAML